MIALMTPLTINLHDLLQQLSGSKPAFRHSPPWDQWRSLHCILFKDLCELARRKKGSSQKRRLPGREIVRGSWQLLFFAKKEGQSRQKKAIRKFVKVANGKIGLLDLNSFRHCSQLGVIRLQEHRWR